MEAPSTAGRTLTPHALSATAKVAARARARHARTMTGILSARTHARCLTVVALSAPRDASCERRPAAGLPTRRNRARLCLLHPTHHTRATARRGAPGSACRTNIRLASTRSARAPPKSAQTAANARAAAQSAQGTIVTPLAERARFDARRWRTLTVLFREWSSFFGARGDDRRVSWLAEVRARPQGGLGRLRRRVRGHRSNAGRTRRAQSAAADHAR